MTVTCFCKPSTPVCRPLLPHREARSQLLLGRFPPRTSPCLLARSSRPDDCTSLPIGPENSVFQKIVTSMASAVQITAPLSGATRGSFKTRPAEVNDSFTSYTEGRSRFWEGSRTKLSSCPLLLDQEAVMLGASFESVLSRVLR